MLEKYNVGFKLNNLIMDYNLKQIYAKMLGGIPNTSNKPKTLSEAVEASLNWKKKDDTIGHHFLEEKKLSPDLLWNLFLDGNVADSIPRFSPQIFKKLPDNYKLEMLEDPNLPLISGAIFNELSPSQRKTVLAKPEIIVKLTDEVSFSEQELENITAIMQKYLTTIFKRNYKTYLEKIYVNKNQQPRTDNLKIQEICNQFVKTTFKRRPQLIKDIKTLEDLFIKPVVPLVIKSYDEVISEAFEKHGLEPDLKPKGKYKVGENITSLEKEDQQPFKILFHLTPPKKGQTEGGTKGSGAGEIALYWLLKSSHPSITDSRHLEDEDDNPDLTIHEAGQKIGLEVKSYPSASFPIGRFKKQITNIKILTIVFGLKEIASDSSISSLDSPSRAEYFQGVSLKQAFNEIIELSKALYQLKTNATFKNVTIFNTLREKIKQIENSLGVGKFYLMPDGTKIAAALLRNMLKNKLTSKPGNGGYMANITASGTVNFYKVDLAKLDQASDEDIIQNTSARGDLKLKNFSKIFGP